jgi:A/G-specific adenine glycosylase
MVENRISKIIVEWFHGHKRDLPWRNISDPYRIWISEIILQQTRVAQGLDYYLRFIDRFPTLKSLAEAHEDEVLKYWQGLGYYSRARNLHAAARLVVLGHNGFFPVEYKLVRALKGIGEYTAAAICSFAYGMSYPTVDGNVYRVLARVFDMDLPIDGGEGKRAFYEITTEILSATDPATHNQAMMEFGALQCVPQNPNCEICPLAHICMAYSRNRVNQLPVKQQKVGVKNRYFNYFCIRFGDFMYLKKRTANDIWRNLYELPLIETMESVDLERLSVINDFKSLFEEIEKVDFNLIKSEVVHVLSHRRIITTYYEVEISNESEGLKDYLRIAVKDFDQYAVSTLVLNLVNHA